MTIGLLLAIAAQLQGSAQAPVHGSRHHNMDAESAMINETFKHFDRARKAIIEDNYDEAERIADASLDLHPEIQNLIQDGYDTLMAEIALGQKEYSRAFKLIRDVKTSPLDSTQTAELSLAYLGLGQVEAARKSLGAYLGTNNRVVFYDECSKYLLPKWQTAGARDLEGIARFIIAVKPAATPLDFDERIHALKLYKGVSSSSGAYNYAEARLEEEFGRTEAAYDYFSKIGATGYKELDDDVTARMGILHRVIEAKQYSSTSTGQSGS